MMVERRVTFDVTVEAQEGEAGENIARSALILMARSLLKADEDLDAAAEADGWKFFVEALPTTYTSNPAWATPQGDVYCEYPGPPMVIIEPNNGGMLGTSGWPKWPPVGTVVWARHGTSTLGELFAYDGEGWRGMPPAQYAEQQTLLESQAQQYRVATQRGYDQAAARSAARSKAAVAMTMEAWATRLGKNASDWEATPPGVGP